MKINKTQILDLKPCDRYNRGVLNRLVPDREEIEAIEILNLGLPHGDLVWLACRLMTREQAVSFALGCAERVLPIWEAKYPDDNRPRLAIEAAKSGDREAAWTAAGDAADAAWVAAGAASDAARAAARATRDAAWAATRDAARAATWAAAWAADAWGDQEINAQRAEIERILT